MIRVAIVGRLYGRKLAAGPALRENSAGYPEAMDHNWTSAFVVSVEVIDLKPAVSRIGYVTGVRVEPARPVQLASTAD
jgi:hypothetical protein